jgi:hypothetical protein
MVTIATALIATAGLLLGAAAVAACVLSSRISASLEDRGEPGEVHEPTPATAGPTQVVGVP